MAYQRNMISALEDQLDELGEDVVESAQVQARDDHEPEYDARECGDGLAIRPLDPLKLGPDVHQEPDNPTVLPPRTLVPLTPARAALGLAAGGLVRDVLLGLELVLVQDILALDLAGLVHDRALAEAEILRGRPSLEVGLVERLLTRHRRRLIGLLLGGSLACGFLRSLLAVASLLALLDARGPAARLALLRSLSVACHVSSRGASAPAS